MSNGVTYERLKELTGEDTPADVKTCLIKNGIPHQIGKRGRPFLLPLAYLQSPITAVKQQIKP